MDSILCISRLDRSEKFEDNVTQRMAWGKTVKKKRRRGKLKTVFKFIESV